MNSKDLKKKAMLEALEKSLGVVTSASRSAGIDRSLHYKWMKEDEEYKEAVADISEVAIDFVESHLHQLIQQGDTAATIFYLKTKAKRRGYVERQEITGEEGQPIIHIAGNL